MTMDNVDFPFVILHDGRAYVPVDQRIMGDFTVGGVAAHGEAQEAAKGS